MRADLRPIADKAGDALLDMPFVPDIELRASHEPRDPYLEAPYDNGPDKDRWWALFFTMLGTRQAAVVDMFISQLQKLVPDKWVVVDGVGQWAGNDHDVRAMFGMIQSMKPKTVAEAALAAQLVALHFNNMKLAAGIASYSMSDARTVATMARATKAYSDGLLALRSLKGKAKKSKQVIKVENHHHHHQHVHLEGGGSDFGERVHAANGRNAGQFTELRALPSQGANGQPVSIPSGQGKARLPDARRRQGKRRKEGAG